MLHHLCTYCKLQCQSICGRFNMAIHNFKKMEKYIWINFSLNNHVPVFSFIGDSKIEILRFNNYYIKLFTIKVFSDILKTHFSYVMSHYFRSSLCGWPTNIVFKGCFSDSDWCLSNMARACMAHIGIFTAFTWRERVKSINSKLSKPFSWELQYDTARISKIVFVSKKCFTLFV